MPRGVEVWVQSYIELHRVVIFWADLRGKASKWSVPVCIITQRSPDRARKIKFQAYFLNYLQIFFNWTKNITMESFFNLWKSLMIEIDGTVVVHWIRSGAGYGKGGWWMVQWVKFNAQTHCTIGTVAFVHWIWSTGYGKGGSARGPNYGIVIKCELCPHTLQLFRVPVSTRLCATVGYNCN